MGDAGRGARVFYGSERLCDEGYLSPNVCHTHRTHHAVREPWCNLPTLADDNLSVLAHRL